MALSAFATIATAAALAPSALAVTPPATVTSAFEDNTISIGVSDAIGYAIANTSGTAQTVTFTDTLPSGVALDNPIGTTNTTGSATCTNLSVTNPSTGQSSNPGDGVLAVSVTVPSVSGSSSSKPVCTISLSVVASAPSNDTGLRDTFSSLSPAGLVATPSSSGLTVLSNPSLSFNAPTSGQSFTLGQISDAAFACTSTDPKDAVDSFFGTDDEGNQIESGAPIDTVDPGSHSLEVDCYSANGGGKVTQSINYTVGSYTLRAVRAIKATRFVSFKTTVPAGKLVARAFYGKKAIGMSTVTPTSRGPVSVTIKPTTAGKKLLSGLKGSSASLKLQVSFTPQAIGTGDQQITPAGATVISKTVKLALAHPAKKKAAKAAKSSKRANRK